MIVAVVAVRVVEVAADQIIGVIAVRNCLVPALRAVVVARVVSGTAVRRRALRGVGSTDADAVLVDVIAMNVMQVPVMKIVAVVAVLDGLMPAAGLVNMLM